MHFSRAACVTCLVATLVTSAIASTGCTSLRPVAAVAPTTQPPAWRVSPGDHIRVTMRDGRQVRITVRTIDPAGITATDDTRYDLVGIRTVERRQVSGVRTGLLIGGIVAGGLFIYGLMQAAALGGFLGGG